MTKTTKKKPIREGAGSVTRRTSRTASTARKSRAISPRQARRLLMVAVDRFAHWTGEAQWMNGYRTANLAKEAELYPTEVQRWNRAGHEREEVQRALGRYTRALKVAK